MRPPSASEVETLAGVYRFEVVATVGAIDAGHRAATWDVVLARPDSARRARARGGPFQASPLNALRLVGTRRGAAADPEPVEWNDGVLVTGCTDCRAGSFELLMIEAVRDDGFRGSWVGIRPVTATVSSSPRDMRGGGAPLPTGYFCAVRLAPR